MVDETWQDRAWAKRGETLRKLAEDTGVPQDVIDRALSGAADAFESAVRRARVEREAMAAAVELALPVVCAEVTRDFLRPALRAAGFDGEVAERYEVTYVPYCGGFNPDMFAQEGDGSADCAGAHWNCQPWPEVGE